MDGYVSRVPTLLGVMAVFALLLFSVTVVASLIARRRPSLGAKVGALALLAGGAAAGIIALRATATLVAQTLNISQAYIEPGFLGYVAPMIFAAFAFALGHWMLKGAFTTRQAWLFYVWLLGFTAANVINRCLPGWCETIEFPLAWQNWSDDIVTFGDADLEGWIAAIRMAIRATIDLATFVAIAAVLTRTSIRSRPA
jgi:hypothetical protein